jgi:hypothetical protein
MLKLVVRKTPAARLHRLQDVFDRRVSRARGTLSPPLAWTAGPSDTLEIRVVFLKKLDRVPPMLPAAT